MSYLYETFPYSSYADMLATGGWIEIIGPTNATYTTPGFLNGRYVVGDNESILMLKPLPGNFEEDATLSPGSAFLGAQIGFLDPLPSDGVGYALGIVSSDFVNGFLVNFVGAEGSPDTYSITVSPTWEAPSVSPPITTFSAGSQTVSIFCAMNTASRILTVQILQGATLRYTYTGTVPAPAMDLNTIYYSMGASPITSPPSYDAATYAVIATYSDGAPPVTYYVPNLVGMYKSSKGRMFRPGI